MLKDVKLAQAAHVALVLMDTILTQVVILALFVILLANPVDQQLRLVPLAQLENIFLQILVTLVLTQTVKFAIPLELVLLVLTVTS